MSIDRVAAISASLVVGISIVVGLWLAGSPTEQRLVRLDNNRRYDLQNLATSIDAFTADKKQLPSTLTELVNGRRLSRLPSDPITGIPYEYTIVDDTHYRLCAEFATASVDTQTTSDDFWAHPRGRKCCTLEAKSVE